MAETATGDTPESRWWALVWNTRLGIRYHLYAQSHYLKLGKLFTIVTLIASSAAFAVILEQHKSFAILFTLLAAFVQILDLVIDTKSNAIQHSSLRQRYVQLEVELLSKEKLTAEEANIFVQQRASIERDEPPLIKHLMTHCHNEQSRVEFGESTSHQIEIGLFTRLKLFLTPF